MTVFINIRKMDIGRWKIQHIQGLKTAGTSAGDTAKWLEEKTTEIGEAAGKLIASNPESKQAFQNGNVAKRLQMIVQAMWQKK